MSKPTRVFAWGSERIAARTKAEARGILLERYDYSDVRRTAIVPLTGEMQYTADGGDTWHSVDASDVSDVWPVPHIIPEL